MYLLFDIGGTHMRLAASKDGKTFGAPKIVLTPANDFEEGMRQFGEITRALAGGEEITAAAGGVAGPFDADHAMLAAAPHIPAWAGQPLKKRLEEIIRAPVYLENDTAVGGLGEAVAGAARGYEIAAYVTVGTGVGGARLINGAIDRNASGFEIGHQIINYDGDIRALEDYVSGSACVRRFGKELREITDSAVWEEAAELLSYGVYNTILHWSPHVLVFGGFLITSSLISLERVAGHLKRICTIFPALPLIKKAELGDESGLHGALILLREKL